MTALRSATRRLQRKWQPQLIALAAGACGVGVFVALAVVGDAVLLRQPFPGADRVVLLGASRSQADAARGPRWSLPLDELNHAASETGLTVAAMGGGDQLGWRADDPILGLVSTNFFDVLGVNPILGRTFRETDAGVLDLAVIGEHLWRGLRDADSEVLGRTVTIGERRFTVIGVVPDTLRLPAGATVWTPLDRGFPVPLTYRALARLPQGQSIEALASRTPGWRFTSMREFLYPNQAWHLLVFLGAGAMLLVAVWIHLTLVLAGNALNRSDELRVRLMLGASRRRVRWDVLTESYVLYAVACAAGLVLAPSFLSLVASQIPADLLRDRLPLFDMRALLPFCLVAGLGAIPVAAVVIPVAGRASGGLVAGHVGSRTITGGAHRARWIVALQFAVVTPVIYLLGMAASSYGALVATDLGFRADGVIAVRLPQMTNVREPGAIERRARELRTLVERIRAIPGIAESALSAGRLGQGLTHFQKVWLSGAEADAVRAAENIVSERYFELLEIPLLAGRTFDSWSHPAGIPGITEVVVDRRLAESLSADGSVIDRQMYVGGIPARIVGIVGIVSARDLREEPSPRFYRNVAEFPLADNLLVRPRQEGVTGMLAVTRLVQQSMSLDAPATYVSLTDELTRLRADDRGRYHVMSLVCLASAAVVAVGLFGLGTFVVASRRREAAVRLALGAGQLAVMWSTLRDLIYAAIAGALVGLLVSVAASGSIRTVFHQAAPLDWAIASIVMLTLMATAVAGMALPVRSIWNTDVAGSLRGD